MLRRELTGARKAKSAVTTAAAADALFAQIRADGVGTVIGGLNPVISAVSAPIFDYRGTLVAALSSLGPSDEFDARPNSPLAQAVRRAADGISRELGYLGTASS